MYFVSRGRSLSRYNRLRIRGLLRPTRMKIFNHGESIMKLTVLVDNNTFVDKYFLAEPGFSVFLEDEGIRVLFDCGYSDIFLINARKMGIFTRPF
jgi:hypothetical protein